MANALRSRVVPASVCIALAAVLCAAATTQANPTAPVKRDARRGTAGLAEARALGGSRCVVRSARRKQTTRRRCNRKPAVAAAAPQPIYWGATIGTQLTGGQAPWDMSAVSKFEEASHKPASLIQFFQPFADCGGPSCTFYGFPTTPLENVRRHGAIPVLSWSSQSIPGGVNEPDFQLSDVIEGRYDNYIREFAGEAAAWGHPFFLRFDWEMNGDWFPWAEGVNGNGPGQYVAAWRHVHDLFVAAGATNVSWVWCPFVDPGNGLQSISQLYPGDAYVDWTGLDGYNWGTNPTSPRGWRSFDQLFSATYAHIAGEIAPAKPMMIGEMGSSEQGGSKSEWIRDALAKIPTAYPSIRAVLWFDKFDDGMDWPLETSASANAAFAEGIQQPTYVGNAFGSLAGGPIQPPS
jgi:hypothetical protein